MNTKHGTVYFVGAGPGDPELLTLKGQRLLAQADLIIYADSLVNPAILACARPEAQVYGSATLDLRTVVDSMVAAARAGKLVVRLHTGDPSIYGATFEQMVLLDEAGIDYEVVPGVTSAMAAAAAIKMELTVPELSQSIILTRVEGRTTVPARENLQSFARHGTTMALFLSAGNVERVARDLQDGGYAADTPVAVVYRATWPDQEILRCSLAELPARMAEARITRQAIILVGPALAPDLKHRLERSASRLYDETFSHQYRTARPHPDGEAHG